MATPWQRITKLTRSIRFRLGLVYSIVFGLCLSGVASLVIYGFLGVTNQEYDNDLRAFAIDLSHFVKPGGLLKDINLEAALENEIKYFPFLLQNTYVSVRTVEGDVLFASGPAPLPYEVPLVSKKTPQHVFSFTDAKGVRMRAINILTVHLKNPLVIQVASAVEGVAQQQRRFFLYLLALIGLSLTITFLISNAVAARALTPISSTIHQLERMLASGDYQGLPVPDTHDEIADLTRAYNRLLEQIRKTLTAQDQFVAHASHQLNTPIAIMRGELELLRSRPRSAEEFQRFHESLGQELARMAQLVQDMLLVSRVEAGRATFHFSSVRFDEVVTETVARLTGHAREKGVALRLELAEDLYDHEELISLHGERQLLGHMCENLIENAIKYSPAQGLVKVELFVHQGQLTLAIRDQGPGMSAEFKEKLLLTQRFFRGAHTENISGTGLGLYLVRKIAEYHGAQLAFENTTGPQGLVAKVVFARSPVPGAPLS